MGSWFLFPSGIGQRDHDGLAAHEGDLSAYIYIYPFGDVLNRPSQRGVMNATVLASDPDFGTLLALAEGIPIVTDPTFRPNGSPPPLRDKYKRMAPCVDRLMHDLYNKGLILILPTTVARTIPGVHFSQTHWARKKGKPWGRPIGDASATDHGQQPLNAGDVKAQIDGLWGPIEHPTLELLSQVVLDQAHIHTWATVSLWKMDLRGAFTLLFVHPDSVCRLAFALGSDTSGEELTMLYHVGMFGWTGMPSAFQVISRVLARLINAEVAGSCLIYVDDIMGC